MSIIDKAKQLAEKDKTDHQNLILRDREERARKEKLLQVVRDRLVKLLKEEIDGQDGFSVNLDFSDVDPNDVYGPVAHLFHKRSPVGVFTVRGETYNIPGCDEKDWRVDVSLKHYKHALPSLASCGIVHIGVVEEGFEVFSDRLAAFLKGFF